MAGESMASTASTNAEHPVSLTDESAIEALERAGRGDRQALLSLYDRYAPILLAVATRVTGSPAEGEEVVQDAMVRAWLEAPSYDRTRGSPIAWLLTLTRNRAIDIVRARGRRTAYEMAATDEALRSEPSPTPESELGDAQRSHAVRRALASLSGEQRAVLDLAYFSGLSHSEIAERLQQPLGTVKTRIAQCIRRLRDELERLRSG